jgi:hypothetical protein
MVVMLRNRWCSAQLESVPCMLTVLPTACLECESVSTHPPQICNEVLLFAHMLTCKVLSLACKV